MLVFTSLAAGREKQLSHFSHLPIAISPWSLFLQVRQVGDEGRVVSVISRAGNLIYMTVWRHVRCTFLIQSLHSCLSVYSLKVHKGRMCSNLSCGTLTFIIWTSTNNLFLSVQTSLLYIMHLIEIAKFPVSSTATYWFACILCFTVTWVSEMVKCW